MKIAVAQLQSHAGDVSANLAKHLELVAEAASQQVDLIAFPELSLTGYEPGMALDFAVDHAQAQVQFSSLKQASEAQQIKICAGMPTRGKHKPRISTLIFSPKQTLQIYSKQILHADEYPFFEAGNQAGIITCNGKRIALAICYEAMQPRHLQQCLALNVDVYLALVAKHEDGISEAHAYFSQVSQVEQVSVALSNNVGKCDNFVGFGRSAVWNASGVLVQQLDAKQSGLAVLTLD